MVVDSIGKTLLPAAFAHLREHHQQRLVQAIQWDVPFAYYFVLASGDVHAPRWLRPDISWDPRAVSMNLISSDELLDHCIERDGFRHLRPDVEWAYQVFKRLRKGGATPAQLAHAQQLQRSVDSLSVGHQLLERRLPRALVHQLRGVIEDGDGHQLARLAMVAKPLLYLPQSFAEPSRQARLQLARSQRRWREPVGLQVHMYGDDATAARQRAQQLTHTMAPVFRGRHHIAPYYAGAATDPSLYRRLRLRQGELQVCTIHPQLQPPPAPPRWGLRVQAHECPIETVLSYLHQRMRRRGWYLVS
ncbi:MAG TPA: hypothetical protein ENK23_02290 [Sorangium sp.]|nr:hypothetical protein [Sorangium sp.]